MRILVRTAFSLFWILALARAPLAQKSVIPGKPPRPKANRSYTGPIFDVHLHTDPPTSAMGMPNPVTGLSPAANSEALRDAVLQECAKYHITHAVLNGWLGTLQKWAERDSKRFLLAPMVLRENRTPVMSAAELKTEIETVFG